MSAPYYPSAEPAADHHDPHHSSEESNEPEVCVALPPNGSAEFDAMVEKADKNLEEGYDEVEELTTLVPDEPEPAQQLTGIAGCFTRLIPPGHTVSGIFNLAGSSLGAGILGLPSAFNVSGIIMGTIYLIVIFLLTVFSMRLLALVTKKTGIFSYEMMARVLFGKGGDIFTAIIMFVKCIGACIAYVICVMDLWHAFLDDPRITGYVTELSFQRVLTTITFLLLMLPLSLPKKINSLRYVSLFGVFFILYFVVCVIIHAATNGLKDGLSNKNLKLFGTGNAAISGMGQFMFAYLCQSNYGQVSMEMKPRLRVSKMEKQVFIGMLLCTIFYWLAGFFAYADFGSAVGTSLLRMYHPLQQYYFAVAYVGLVIKLCVAFALHILPCRDAVHHVVGWDIRTVAWWKNAVLCTFLSVVSLICGLFIPNVNIVFGLLGSFTGGFIAFVFPSLFFIYSGKFSLKQSGAYDYFGAYILLLCGVIVVCFGTTATIYNMV